MKIVITGASGFVGQNLDSHLKRMGNETLPFSLRTLDWEGSFPLNADAIIHLAGKAHDTSNTSQPDEYFKINRDLTISLFSRFLESNIRDFFFFSSVKAVADIVDGVLKEDTAEIPLTPYGKSKQEAEAYLLNQKLPFGKRLFIIRPCMIHGPGNKGNLNLLYKVVKKGIPYPLASFKNQRSFLSIQNLNYIIGKIITDKNIAGGIYNVADDEALSTNEVIKLIGEADGRKAKLWKINSGIIRTLASIGDKLHLPLNSERLKKLTESYIVSNDKIKHALKIEKLPVSSRQGLLTTIKSFRTI